MSEKTDRAELEALTEGKEILRDAPYGVLMSPAMPELQDSLQRYPLYAAGALARASKGATEQI